jgi:arylsulfatase A-like enzyme
LRDGKGSVYEGGVRGVAFVTWKDQVPAGAVCREPVHIIDWYPTLIKLVGGSLEQPLPLDGVDIWPVITQRAKSPHAEILHNSTPSGGAIRVGDWKLIIKTGKGSRKNNQSESVELFNLATDPSEKTNLAQQNPEKLRELRARYLHYASAAVPPKNLDQDE